MNIALSQSQGKSSESEEGKWHQQQWEGTNTGKINKGSIGHRTLNEIPSPYILSVLIWKNSANVHRAMFTGPLARV